MTFDEWKKEVDVVCVKAFGLSSDDLEDCLWAEYHSDELSPTEAVECAVEDVWGPSMPYMYDLWYKTPYSEVV